MREAAQDFLGSLRAEQRAQAVYDFAAPERVNWNYVPMPRRGLPFAQMEAAQHDLALELLRTGLSQRGRLQAETIIALEDVLKELEGEGGGPRRDRQAYYVTVFGTPSDAQSWGWRFEGHHLALNFTIVDGARVFCAPSFMGANPAEVRSGPRQGVRVMAEEDDLARALVKSLDEAQRAVAVYTDKTPREILTGNRESVEPLSPVGITGTALRPEQREKLEALVRLYLDRYRPELADEMYAKIVGAGLDRIAFAWAGGFERGQANYYRIQGPTFLIEFANTQNQANHIHTVFREFGNDFGRDLLREHYAREHREGAGAASAGR